MGNCMITNDGAKELLKKLCDMPCVSGFEIGTDVARIVEEEFGKYCDEVRVDVMGNIVGLKKGRRNGSGKTQENAQENTQKVLYAAHIDEIGLMVSGVDKHGLVNFVPLGGFDQRALICQEVVIHSHTGEEVYGVIGAIPPHLLDPDKKDKAEKLEKMGIDIGYDKDEVEGIIKIGDRITIRRKCEDLQGGFVTGKALDDRAGIIALIEAMDMLKDFSHDCDIYFAATVQEEESAYGGAFIAAYDAEPDIAVAVDVGFAKTPDLTEFESVEIGKGPALAIGPNINRKVFERLKNAAKENGIPYQVEVKPGHSGTDAYSMQIAKAGAATGVISIPLKYMHTSVEIVKMDDIKSTARLMAAFVMDLNNDEFTAF